MTGSLRKMRRLEQFTSNEGKLQRRSDFVVMPCLCKVRGDHEVKKTRCRRLQAKAKNIRAYNA